MKTETEQLQEQQCISNWSELIRALKDARNELVDFRKFIRSGANEALKTIQEHA